MKFINKEGKVFDTIKVADDDYTFTVKLCDNEIDDDNERFSSQCLEQMAEMFVGKYGCIGETRIAKIVSTEIVTDENKWATFHERYQWLKATVIIPRSNETEQLTSPKVLVVDIGGFTADYVRLRNGVPDMSACDSLENGVILLYNRVRARANAELDVLLDESEIDCILHGEHRDVAPEVVELVEKEAQEFVNDLLSGLRERMLELKSGRVIFLGGGANLLRRQIEASGKVGQATFVEDINANAKGYAYLYRLQHGER